MGIDPGRKRIGVAASDASRLIASPVDVVVRRRWKDDVACLRKVVDARGMTGIVLGLAFNMDGSEGSRARSAWQTGINLQNDLGLPVLMWDERLSTFEAEEIIAGNRGRRHDDRYRIDAVAASVILRDALDALRRAPCSALDQERLPRPAEGRSLTVAGRSPQDKDVAR